MKIKENKRYKLTTKYFIDGKLLGGNFHMSSNTNYIEGIIRYFHESNMNNIDDNFHQEIKYKEKSIEFIKRISNSTTVFYIDETDH